MNTSLNNFLNVLLVSFNFCRPDEAEDPYGISCLKTAFNTSDKKQKQDIINSFVIDLNLQWNTKDIIDAVVTEIRRVKCNVIAFSNFIWSDRIITNLLPVVRKEFPEVKIIMGGPMVCGSEEQLNHLYREVDLFIKSFGEKVFSDLRKYLVNDKSAIEVQPDFKKIYSPYLMNEISIKDGMSVRMETRRGCKFNCSYCRHRNANCKVYEIGNEFEKVRSELEFFAEKNVGKINMLDPYFNDINLKDMSKARGLNVLNLCKELNIKSQISVQIRPEMLTKEYLEKASDMKNVIFEIGIQSLDPKVYPLIRRGNKKARSFILNKLNEVVRNRINTELTLIYGLPGQTYDSFAYDVELLKNMGFTDIKAFPLQIYPATEIMNTYEKYDLKVRKVEPYGILQVYDNPSHDFDLMDKFALSI